MKNTLLLCALVLVVINFVSCSLTDNEKPVPYFLDLKNPVVKAPGSSNNDTHKITEVWVFSNGQIQGVFPLPAIVPLFFDGSNAEITLLAGIRNNGMNDTPAFYPFYKSIVKVIQPVANETISIPLNFEYVANAKIPVNESFETVHCFNFVVDNNPDTNMKISSETASLGAKSGLVSLSSSLRTMEIGCSRIVDKGENSRGQSYIELDYKGEGEIAIGIAKTRGNVFTVDYVLFVPGKQEWNKIYVDVTDKLSVDDYSEYRLVLGFTRTGFSLESNIYVDNIKHLHF